MNQKTPRRAPFLLLATLVTGLVACATPPRERAAASLARAESLRSQRQLTEAAAAYDDALRHDPTNLVALRGLVELHHRLGRLGELEDRFREAVRRAPGDPYAHEGLGLVLFARGGGSGPEAIESLRRAATLAPEIADFQYRLGLALVESDRFAEAVAPLAAAVKAEPERARLYLPYAVALARSNDRAGAIAALGQVLRLRPTREEVALAEKTAKSLLDPFRGFPDAAREQFEIALSWLQGDAPMQARRGFEAILEKFPDLAIVHAMAGLCSAKMDDAGGAIVSFRRAMEIDPSLAEPRMYLADLYYGRGRPDSAIEHYEAALARNPFLPEAHFRLAEALRKTEKTEAALEHYTTYTLLRPGDFDAAAARATLLTDLKRTEAGAAWDELVRTFPRRVEGLVGRGRYYYVRAVESTDPAERREARRKAVESLEAAVEVDPENSTASHVLREARALR